MTFYPCRGVCSTGCSFAFFDTVSAGPLINTFSCDDFCEGALETFNVTVSWTLSGGDNADFYFINITTNASQTPYGGLLNITAASVTQHKLTGFRTDSEYNITVRGNCGGQDGSESKPLTITPQGTYTLHT